jgi:hypothetical protein
MVDTDTFLTILHIMVDDFCKASLPPRDTLGRRPPSAAARTTYGAQVVCPHRRNSKRPWPRPLWRWLASVHQIVETVHDKLHHTFRLDRERPPALSGLQARLAAKIALQNFCIWLNAQLGEPRLAFTDLVDW